MRLWERTPRGCAFFSRDMYDMISEGDDVVIEVEIGRPDGPGYRQVRLPGAGAAAADGSSPHASGGAGAEAGAGAAAGIAADCMRLDTKMVTEDGFGRDCI